MTWVDQSSVFAFESELTSTQMQNLRDNNAAQAAGDAGAPVQTILGGGTGYTVVTSAFSALKQTATNSETGVVQKATQAFVNSGINADYYVTPETLKGVDFLKGSWVPITEAVVDSDATIDFTDISSEYSLYKLVIDNLKPVDNNVVLRMRVGTGATPTWITGTLYNGSNEAFIAVSSTGQGNASNLACSGIIDIHDPANASEYTKIAALLNVTDLSGDPNLDVIGGNYSAATAVTALRLYFATGYLLSGTITLHGLRK